MNFGHQIWVKMVRGVHFWSNIWKIFIYNDLGFEIFGVLLYTNALKSSNYFKHSQCIPTTHLIKNTYNVSKTPCRIENIHVVREMVLVEDDGLMIGGGVAIRASPDPNPIPPPTKKNMDLDLTTKK